MPSDLTNVVAIAGGNNHSLTLKADGTVVAWGDNNSGQTNVPSGLSNVIAIAGGRDLSLAVVGNGPLVSHVPLVIPRLGTNGFTVSVPTRSGRVYRLEYKTSLTDGAWTALPLVAGNGGVRTLTDPTANGAQRFYRVRQW